MSFWNRFRSSSLFSYTVVVTYGNKWTRGTDPWLCYEAGVKWPPCRILWRVIPVLKSNKQTGTVATCCKPSGGASVRMETTPERLGSTPPMKKGDRHSSTFLPKTLSCLSWAPTSKPLNSKDPSVVTITSYTVSSKLNLRVNISKGSAWKYFQT